MKKVDQAKALHIIENMIRRRLKVQNKSMGKIHKAKSLWSVCGLRLFAPGGKVKYSWDWSDVTCRKCLEIQKQESENRRGSSVWQKPQKLR